jgi:hypothetical protein
VRAGITIQHASERSEDSGLVRSDILGVLAVIPGSRWPKGATRGDYVEFTFQSASELEANPAKEMFDPVSRRALRSFFENGGQIGKLIGLCIQGQDDLLREDPGNLLWEPLFDRLRGEEDIGILIMPLLAYLPVRFGRDRVDVAAERIMGLLLEHCRQMNNRFVIFDTPRDLHEEALLGWVEGVRSRFEVFASYGAIYYPWLMAGDEMFPPSGAVAGIFARVENEHSPLGVRWPPANEVVEGVTHPAVSLKWRESGSLTEAGINPILVQPTRGVVVWGARTLARDSAWKHVNSRRIVSYISEQIRRDSAWVVFEQQRPELWRVVERMVRSRLDELWGGGMLSGETAGAEYLVQCDEELNPPAVRDAGQVHVKVLVRPVTTAEYIVVELRLGGAGSV